MTTQAIPTEIIEFLVVRFCERAYAERGERFADAQWMNETLRSDPLGDPWEVVKHEVIAFCGVERLQWHVSNDRQFFYFWDGEADEQHPDEDAPSNDEPMRFYVNSPRLGCVAKFRFGEDLLAYLKAVDGAEDWRVFDRTLPLGTVADVLAVPAGVFCH
jgi:hypothetical protein